MVAAETVAPGPLLPREALQEGVEVRRLLAPLSRENLISLLCSAAASNPRVLEEIRSANRRTLRLLASGSASCCRHRHCRHRRRDQQFRPNPNRGRDLRNPSVRTGNKGEILCEFFSQYDDTEQRALFKNSEGRNLQIRRPPDGSAGRDSLQ